MVFFRGRARHVASVIVTLLICCGACALAQSARPRNSPAQDKTAKDAQRTERKLQAIVRELRLIHEQRAKAEQRRAEYESYERSKIDWPQIYTAAVATVGIVIGIFTLVALTKQVAANIEAANAAKNSADTARTALRVTEAADIHLDRMDSTTPRLGAETRVILVFRNYGRTRATNAKFEWFNWVAVATYR